MQVFRNNIGIELSREDKEVLRGAFNIVKDVRDEMLSNTIVRMSNVYTDTVSTLNYDEVDSAVSLLNALSYYDKISLLREKE